MEMLPRHWLMLTVAIIAGFFIQKYWDPLGKIGL